MYIKIKEKQNNTKYEARLISEQLGADLITREKSP